MRAGSVFHPLYFYHARPTVNSTMVARVEIWRPTGEHSKWVPGEGQTGGRFEKVWAGNARLQPNKDWRARARDFEGEFVAQQAVRIQIPIGKNEVGAVLDANDKIIEYGDDPDFGAHYRVYVTETPVKGTEFLMNKTFIVRNALRSTNTWLYNLLCDSDTT